MDLWLQKVSLVVIIVSAVTVSGSTRTTPISAPVPLGDFLVRLDRLNPTTNCMALFDMIGNTAVANNTIYLTGSQQMVYLTLSIGVNRNTNTGQQVRVLNGLTEALCLHSSVDNTTSHDTISNSRLVLINSDTALTITPSASLVLGQPFTSFFSGFSLSRYFQQPLAMFDYSASGLNTQQAGRVVFSGNIAEQLVPKEGVYFVTLTAVVSSAQGIDMRLLACNSLFPLRRFPNVFPEQETMQVSALVNCTANQRALMVERTDLETISDANLFGFLYNPVGPSSLWSLSLTGTQATSANRVNVTFLAPAGIIRSFVQNVRLPVGAGTGSVCILTSGRYLLHLLVYFVPGPGIDVQVEVVRRSRAMGSPLGFPFRIFRLLTQQRQLNNAVMDTMSRSGVVDLSATDELRVTLGSGTLLTNSMFSGMLLTPTLTVQ